MFQDVHRTRLLMVAVMVAAQSLPCSAQANPASGVTTTGQVFDVEIAPPRVQPVDACDQVLIDAFSQLGAVPPVLQNFLYISDLSGSMESAPFVAGVGDANGDGVPDTKLDAVVVGLHALNQSLGNPAYIDVGCIGFGATAALADSSPLAGRQNFISPPQADLGGTAGTPDIEEVIASMDTGVSAGNNGTFNLFDPTTGLGAATNYTAALQVMNDTFAAQPAGERNVGFFLSDGQPTGGGSYAAELARAQAAGTIIDTFAIGTGAGGCGATEPLGEIAAATGGSCTLVTDPSTLATVLPGAVTTNIASIDIVVNGVQAAITTGSEPAFMNLLVVDIAPYMISGMNQVDSTSVCEDGTSVTATAFIDATGGRLDPNIYCPSVVEEDAAAGSCDAVVNFNVTADDDCMVSDLQCNPASGSLFNIGTTPVHCTATDVHGFTADCDFDVIVHDVTPPTIDCRADPMDTDPGICQATAVYRVRANDDCALDRVDCTPAVGSLLPLGMTHVSCTAFDLEGNTANCQFDVEVRDVEDPVIHCPSGTVVVGVDAGVCGATASYQVTADDNCNVNRIECTPAVGTLLSLGVTQVNCTAYDDAGNTAQCSFDIDVVDDEAPAINCPASPMVVSVDAGVCGATAAYNVTAVDNCAIDHIDCTPAVGTLLAVGVTQVNCIAYDTAGNTDQCSFDVDVVDDEAPTINCPASPMVVSVDAGVCGATAAYNVTAVDNCAIDHIDCTPAVGSLLAVGVTQVNCIAYDTAGNTDQCSFDVDVVDDEAPAINCPASPMVVSVDAGVCGATAAYNVTAVDNCAIDHIDCTPAVGTLLAIGVTQVNCIAYDTAGNTDQCSFDVDVVDDEAPAINCPASPMVVSVDAGVCGATAAYNVTAVDNCAIDHIDCTPAVGTLLAVGVTQVNCIAYDTSGNTDQCSFDVDVVDDEAPAINCPASPMVVSVDAGVCGATAAYNVTAVDNCAIDHIDCTPAVGTLLAIGVTQVNCIAYDTAGNTDQCSFDVDVVDDEAPTINCPTSPMVVSVDASTCGATAAYNVTAVDNCAIDHIDCTPAVGTLLAVGVTQVNCIAYDTAGNTDQCSFDIDVVDDEAPTITCPTSPVAMSVDAGVCGATAAYNVTAVDNCAIDRIDCTPAVGTLLAVGVTQVNCTAFDTSGNTDQCSFDVDVVDDEAPTINCPASPAVVSVDAGVCGATAAYNVTAVDNCAIDHIDCTPAVGTLLAIGVTQVNCIAYDTAGNTDQCSFDVDVVDDEAPTINCPASPMVVSVDAGTCGATAAYNVTAVDNCAIDHIDCTPAVGTLLAVGVTQVNCIAYDTAGNTDQCSFDVDVVDDEAPTINCPASPMVVSVDAGVCGATAAYNVTAVDNCAIDHIDCTPAVGTLLAVGVTQVNCIAYDTSGNTDQCSFDVDVVDDEAPTINCPTSPMIVSVDAGVCGATAAYNVTAVDNCAIDHIDCTPAVGTLLAVGVTQVNCIAYDTAGNTDQCSFDVDVVDDEAPTINCPTSPMIVSVDAGVCGATAAYNVTAVDNCAIDHIDCTPAVGTLLAVGVTQVNCIAYDTAGNTDQCSFDVDVVDDEAPTINCPASPMVVSVDAGVCGATAAYNVTAVDNCAIDHIDCTPAVGTLLAVGVTQVNCIAYDTAGNTDQCSFDVDVVDDEAPTINCPASPMVVSVDAGVCGATAAYNVTAVDNCAIDHIDCTPADGSLLAVGVTQVNCIAYDTAGNTDQCSFDVDVVDDEAPTINCPASPMVVSVDAGVCGATAAYNVTAVDNCAIDHIDCTPAVGTLLAVGVTQVNCIAYDTAGNTDQCSFDVDVVDDEAPTINCPASPMVVSVDAGVCGATAAYNVTAVDNCAIDHIDCTPAVGTLLAVGVTQVNCIAYDTAGNTDQCSFDVDVVDDEAPTINCPASPMVVSVDAGVCGATAAYNVTAVDNCAIDHIDCTPAVGSLLAVGVTQVNCIAYDTAGNTDQCSFDVDVVDDEAPTINCPAATIVTGVDPGVCGATAAYNVTAVDNCAIDHIDCTPAVGTLLAVGVTQVNCIAYDTAGNTDQCSFDIDVLDDEAPTINCPAATIVTGVDPGVCGATAAYNVTAVDNCAIDHIDCTPAVGTLLPIGISTVNCTAFDTAGNTAQCSFDIDVLDDEAPAINCPASPMVVSVDAGVCGATAAYNVTAVDNCAIDHIDCTPAVGSLLAVGVTQVNCIAYDTAGNTDQCSFDVDVVDDEAPTINCPAATIVTGVDPGVCGATAAYNVTAVDNCAIDHIDCTPAVGTLLPIGISTVNCTAFDTAGNTAQCSFDIDVLDDEAPTINCPAATIVTGVDPGVCGATAIYNVTAADNCAIDHVDCAPAVGTLLPIGVSTVNCTAFDTAGNIAQCSFDIDVLDDEAPTINCPAATIVTGVDPGVCGATAIYNVTAADNCAIDHVDCAPAVGTLLPIGVSTVNCTAFDTAGNTAQCSFDIDVLDDEAPTINCPAATIVTGVDPGVCGATAIYNVTAADNCAIDHVDCAPAVGTLLPLGISTVNCTAFDTAGNTAQCSFDIEVIDDEDPTLTVPPSPVIIGVDPGLCAGTSAYQVTADDNCGLVNLVCAPDVGVLLPVGITQVNCTAIDGAGRIVTDSFDLQVVDDESPVIHVPVSPVILSVDTSVCGATAVYSVTANDNCAVDHVDCLPTVGTLLPVGITQVNCIAYDTSGNTDSDSFDIEVIDDEDPDLVCPSGTIVIPTDAGVCSGTATYQVFAADNCGIDRVECTPAAGSLLPVGVHTVGCTAYDVHGNTSTCAFDIRVEDQELPVIVCNSGQLWPANHAFEMLAIGYSDNCDSLSELSYVVGVTSDEHPALIVGAAGRLHCPDAIVHPNGSVEVRRERSGTEDGRVYIVDITVTDRAGNQTQGTCHAGVPHDQHGPPALPSSPTYDATDCGGAGPSTPPITPGGGPK